MELQLLSEQLNNLKEGNSEALSFFFDFSLAVLPALHHYHQQQGYHHGLNPNTISMDNNSNIVFHKTQGLVSHVAPELQGRLFVLPDHRADLYALGLMFYEIVSQTSLKTEGTQLEISYLSVAGSLPSLQMGGDPILDYVMRIIRKLVEKDPVCRYQSVYGVYWDIQCCVQIMQKKHTDFEIGKKDSAASWTLATHDFSRESLEEKIRDELDNFPVLCGNSGVGKSHLMHVVCAKYCSAEFHMILVPFYERVSESCVGILFDQLLVRVLALDVSKRDYFKQSVRVQLGDQLSLLFSCITNISMLFPDFQPKSVIQDTTRHMFWALKVFLELYIQQVSPLVVAFDDLQWANEEDRQFIQVLLQLDDASGVTLIGTSRDVDNAYGVSIDVQCWSQDDLMHYLQQVVFPAKQSHTWLAQHMIQKTEGNAFYCQQFLTLCYDQKLLYFSFDDGCWQWDESGILALFLEGPMEHLMTVQCESLDRACIRVMSVMSVFGMRISLKVLEDFLSDVKDVWSVLVPAIKRGLVVLDDREISFSHDVVYQYCKNMLSLDELRDFHHDIAMFLQARNDGGAYEVDVAFHYNQVVDFEGGSLDFREVIEANILAGRQLHDGYAFESADFFLSKAWGLIQQENLEGQPFQFSAPFLLAENHYRRQDTLGAKTVFLALLKHPLKVLDQVEIYNQLVLIYMHECDYHAAIESGQRALGLLAIDFPDRLKWHEVLFDFIKGVITYKQPFPLLKTQYSVQESFLISSIFYNLVIPIYYVRPDLIIPIWVKMSCFVINHATDKAHPFYDLRDAFIMFFAWDLYRKKVTFSLDSQVANRSVHILFLTAYGVVSNHWEKPARQGLPFLQRATELGMEAGDFVPASLSAIHHVGLQLFCGVSLGDVKGSIHQFQKQFQVFDGGEFSEYMSHLLWFLDVMKDCPSQLPSDHINIEQWESVDPSLFYVVIRGVVVRKAMPYEYQGENQNLVAMKQVLTLCALYYFSHHKSALLLGVEIEKQTESLVGSFYFSEFYFYHAMNLVSLWSEASCDKRRQYEQAIQTIKRKFFKLWKSNSSENFSCRHDVLHGELMRIRGRDPMPYFQSALESATAEGFLQMRALILERLFYYQYTCSVLGARYYLQDAISAYVQWGADAKALQLRHRLQQLYPEHESGPLVTQSAIDFESVLKASQLISGELDMVKLVPSLLTIVAQKMGAERVLLVVRDESGHQVLTEYSGSYGLCCWHERNLEEYVSEMAIEPVRYVLQSGRCLVVDDALCDPHFSKTVYIQEKRLRSLVVFPIHKGEEGLGVLYFENFQTSSAFSTTQLQSLEFLSNQIAISLKNAMLHGKVMALHAHLRESERERLRTQEREKHTKTLSYFISHEVKNALYCIQGYTSVLQKKYSEKAVQNIESVSQRLSDFSNDYLLQSRLASGLERLHVADERVSALIGEAIDDNRYLIEENCIKVQLDGGEDVIRKVDGKLMLRVFVNIIQNAIKFSKEGGTIYIKYDTLGVYIIDEGEGLEPGVNPFELFEKSDVSTQAASGLGLSIAQHIVKLHGGKISIKNNVKSRGVTVAVEW